MPKYILLVILLFILMAVATGYFLCNKYNKKVDLSGSGISGIALLGPICPVERIPPDPACAPRPYKTKLSATNAEQTKTIKEFESDINGKFSVDLSAGEYIIISANNAGIFSRCLSQGSIKVEKDKYTNITLNCDTGIR